jgi:general secretion pathway protein B
VSLILDALNRARQDDNPVPGLSTYHPVDQVSVNRRQYALWVALSIAVVLIAWLIVERYSAPQLPAGDIGVADIRAVNRDAPVVSPAPAASAVQRPAVTPGPAPAVERVSPEQERARATQAVQSSLAAVASAGVDELNGAQAQLVDDTLRDAGQSQTAAVAETAPQAAVEPEENSAVAELYRNPPVEPAYRKPQQQPAARATERGDDADVSYDVNKLVQLAREEAKNLDLTESPVPLLIDLSQQVKDSIPTIYYLRHDYSSNGSNSTVVLNSKTLNVGDSAAVGLKVEEILPDSVVLNYQGTQFRLRALNSWINL